MTKARALRFLPLTLASVLLLGACDQTSEPNAGVSGNVQQQFLANITAYCGKAFEGEVVSDDTDDSVWQQRLVMHIRDCVADEVKIPLHVGEDRSRTWVISETDTGLQLQHIHLHEDGTPDATSPYGGHTNEPGTANQQAFPVDEASKTIFAANDLIASQKNTWTITFIDDNTFSYKLSRPGRLFEVHFDLTKPVAVPPPAWGYESATE
ncbi:MAG: hypothetical protein WEA82_10005 [Idiomarina sp.]